LHGEQTVNGLRKSPELLFSIFHLERQHINININIKIYTHTLKTELKEEDNISLFAANGKRKFVFLGRQMINGNRRLLFQQTCPSILEMSSMESCGLQLKDFPTMQGLSFLYP
jgi:hypothetical protein